MKKNQKAQGEPINQSQQQSVQPQQPMQQQPEQQQAAQNKQIQQPQFRPQGVPAEVSSGKAGKVLGIISIVLGAVSLIGTIFTGPIGIILGALAISKGEKTLGIIGISLSVALMVIGLVMALMFMEASPEATGILPILF